MVAQHPDVLTGVRPNGLEDTPQFKIDIDQEKAQALGVSISDINTTLGAAWGGSYVNDFIDRGRVKKVYIMSEAKYRMLPEDIGKWYVRGSDGQMVPGSLLSRPRVGNTVRRVWNATTVCRHWKSSVRPRQARVPVRRWR